jgi:hypothetical protein
MKKIIRVSSLLIGLVCFVAFMVLSCGAHYVTTGLFPDAEPVAVYAILAAIGGLSVIFRRYRFAILFYFGAVLGWLTGRFISGLEGSFAPTAALIATWFLIGVFALLGLLAEISHLKRAHRKKLARREKEQQADAQRQAALQKEQEAKAKAAQAAQAASDTPSPPPKG